MKCLGPSLSVNRLNRLGNIGGGSCLHLLRLVFLLESVVKFLSLRVLTALFAIQVNYLCKLLFQSLIIDRKPCGGVSINYSFLRNGVSTFNFGLEALDLGICVMNDFIHSCTKMAVSFGQVLGDVLLIGAGIL